MIVIISMYAISVVSNTVAVTLTDPKYNNKFKNIFSKVFKITLYSAFPVVNIFIPSFLLACYVANTRYFEEENNKKVMEEVKKEKTTTQMQNKLHFKKVELMKLKEDILNEHKEEIDKPKQKTLGSK